MTATSVASHIRKIFDGNPFPLLLVCVTGILLLIVFAPALIVGDTWLTLVAGREVVEHGLPSTDQLTLLSRGGTWTDQQWLAQVLFYGVNVVGGLRAVVLVDVLLVLLTLAIAIATARSHGATGRSTFILGLLGVLAGPWGWTIRAQAVALPFFAAALWLLVDASRRGLRRRTLLVLPLLVVWANLHGSVVLGAGLAVVLGASELVRRRSSRWLALALVVGAPLCVLASPYATKLPAYYHLMLVDPPFADMLREWQWSRPAGTTIVFYLLALLALVLVAVGRSRRPADTFRVVDAGGAARRRRRRHSRRDLVRARHHRCPPTRARWAHRTSRSDSSQSQSCDRGSRRRLTRAGVRRCTRASSLVVSARLARTPDPSCRGRDPRSGGAGGRDRPDC